PDYDLFISYRHSDNHLLRLLRDELQRQRPELKLFIDQERLNTGGYWKQELIRGLSRCKKALCFVTVDYPNSIECMDEFHASVLWNQIRSSFIVPILNMPNNKIASLPESIRSVQSITTNLPNQSAEEVATQVFRIIDGKQS
ncbi:MAG: TIR domain-containing protein, partial [Planctomycetes bacterium]|nr:TIR domain-containing protein [Planctomycetota bacterium]